MDVAGAGTITSQFLPQSRSQLADGAHLLGQPGRQAGRQRAWSGAHDGPSMQGLAAELAAL